MGLGRDTVRAALFTVAAGLVARIIGLVGTLVITRFVAPAEYGVVSVAAVLVLTANQLSTLGFGQYIVSNPGAGRATTFHATTYHVLLGVLALAALVAIGARLAGPLDAPGLVGFLPGLAAAALFDRVAFVPERVLARDLRFGVIGWSRTTGDLVYAGASVWLAAIGWGAMAIVMGNLVRSFVRLAFAVAAVHWRDWIEPTRLSLEKTRELFAFGVPMAVSGICHFASRRWDNLLVSRFFGAGPVGMYNLAYNLADVPAIQVGEQIGDVLLPSFARLPPEQRPAALLRALGLLALSVFPLAVGLAAIAPTLVDTLFDERWRPVAPMLILLSALSVARPVSWAVASYLLACQRPRMLMWLEGAKVVLLVVAIVTIGRLSPLWTCFAVGLAFGAHSVASLWAIERIDGLSLKRSLAALGPALVACAPMVAVVLALRAGLVAAGLEAGALRLVLETVVGGFAYVGGAFLFAREQTRELLERVLGAIRPRARAQ